MKRIFLVGLLAISSLFSFAQNFTGTPTKTPAGANCAGASITVTWALTGPAFGGGNAFNVELSTAVGAFPGTILGTLNSTNGTSLAVTIPLNQAQGNAYRIRITSTSPIRTSANTANFTINAVGFAAPTVSGSPFCQGATFNITNNLTSGCSFGTGNNFSVELSDAAGSFASPTVIAPPAAGATGGLIAVTIPAVAAGTGYLMRVVGTSPPVTSPNSAAFSIGTVLNAPTFVGSTFCAGDAFNITNNLGTGCSFSGSNNFTVQLSNSAGSFASPTVIGTALSTATGGTIPVTIPNITTTGAGYLIRVVSSSPTPIATSPSSSAITINAIGLAAPTVAGSPFCQGATFNITNNLSASGCNFGTGNTFNVELSNAAGSFASPTIIRLGASGVAGGLISVTIPLTQAPGTGYRIRVVGTNPSVTSANNGTNITISQLLNAPTSVPATLCQGSTFSITNNLSAGTGCSFNSLNTFTVELSDATGSFVSATPIGTVPNTTVGGLIPVTIPDPTPTGTLYRIRVVGSSPAVVGPNNGSNLTVSGFGINAPTFAGTTFCPNQALTVNYTVLNACALSNTPSANIFTAQLSDSFGSFTSPTNIGSTTSNTFGSISTTIPVAATAGNGYRIRVVSSNPGVGLTSPDNGANLTINAINLNAPTFAGTTFCPGSSVTLSYTFVSSCNFIVGNSFTAQLSDASGSFASPTSLLPNANTAAPGNFTVTIPTTTPAGSGYRIRIVGSTPFRTSPDNGTNITVNAYGINAPTFTGTSFCQGQPLTISYTIQNGCGFPNTPSNNVFTAQLSNATGSFASPTTIGTVPLTGVGSISASIPGGTPAGTAYRIRVVSSNPGSGIIGADNGTDITINASSGNPAVFGTTAWNAYAYSGNALSSNPTTISSNVFVGTYTENNLSFDTRNRWADNSGPGAANASSGLAYTGCPIGSTTYAMSFKRTNITCGYYQIDIPGHDDDVRLFIDGVQVFSHAPGCCDSHTNAWTGFIGPTTTVEFQFINGVGPGFLQATFSTATNPLTISTPVTVCSTSSTNLNVSSPIALSYAWTPTTGLTPPSGLGASVVAAGSAGTTTYTATGTDATTSCSVSKSVLVTVVSAATIPTIALTNVAPTICSGITTTTLTASGASTYTWSPAAGLSSTTSDVVTANPAITTLYTVTGSTGCQSNTASTTVTVQNIPPAPTVFGNATWNVYCHYNNTTLSNYYGYYTENNLSFNTTTRWGASSGPSVANASSGLAYSGCTFLAPTASTNYSMSFKRTNFTCGYYQLNIDFLDDRLTILVDGVQVFQNNVYTPTLQTNVWTGFLGPTTTVEFRLINNGGPGQMQATFLTSPNSPQTVSPDATICAGTNSGLTVVAAAYPSATYSWSVSPADPTITLTPSNTVSNPFFQTTGATPAGDYIVTNVMTDVGGTGCTAPATRTIKVDPLPNTQVSPTSATITCPTASVTLTASGANTYTWSPSLGLSAITGFTVDASPTTTTVYTVTGSNNCSTNSAVSTITVIPLPAITTFPTGTWNVYGFNSQTIGTNYQGYYTENGSGPTGYSFNTQTRWANGGAPSTANATNGNAWIGCAMNTSNISISAKRTGFACGVYQLDVPAHDDDFYLLINGVQVARHNGCCDTHTNVWTGVLNSNSTVEWQMQQGSGGSYLQVAFTLIAQPATTTVWLGGVSNDWFDPANWCNAVPTATTDALIPAAGPQNMPVINNTGALVRNITISPSIAATGGPVIRPLIAAASLTTNAFNLDVNGNWINNGTYTANSGTISFVGSGVGNTISTSGTQTFNNIIVNKTNGITFSTGTSQVSGAMTFTNGLVTQSGTFRFLNGSSAVGANNSSYVIGVVTKVGNNAFTFPVGAGNLYRPISISAPSVATDTYTAQYFNVNPNGSFPNASRAGTLDHVSGAEYWLLNRTSGTSNVNVTLSWGSNSGLVGNLSSLRVAAWNGSFWTDQGNGGTTGNTTAGTVVTGAPSSVYGPYTLATIDNSNPLPVELISFNCNLLPSGFVELKWATASELNSDFFSVERATNSSPFKSIAEVKSAGTTAIEHSYSYEDKNAPSGFVYYRLKQVDLDGTAKYYQVCTVELPTDNSEVKLYPNPTLSGTTYINLNGATFNSLSIANSLGAEINCSYTVEESRININTSSLMPGLYIVRIVLDQKLSKLKLIVQR